MDPRATSGEPAAQNGTVTDFTSMTPDQLRARGSQKWNNYPADVIPLWVAEMDFPMAPAVTEAIHATVAADGFGYAVKTQELPSAFAAFAARRLDQHIDPQLTTIIPDVLTGVVLAIQAHSTAGSPVVVPTPSYMPFLAIPGEMGRELVPVPLVEHTEASDAHHRWTLDLAGIDAAFAAGARTLILCQPYNPVGRMFTPDELRALAEVVDRHGAWVVSDEIHAPLTMPGVRHVGYAGVSDIAASHSSTITSASKSFTMPGLPCATITHHTEQANEQWTTNAPAGRIYGATTLGINANIAAFTQGDEWLDGAMAQVAENSATMSAWLAEHAPQARYLPAEATYFAWIDWRECGLGDAPAEWFLEHAKVWMNSGPAFGEVGKGFSRLNLATTPAILSDALGRMAGALASR